jgi:hypothetical protein
MTEPTELRSLANATVQCPVEGCDELVTRIERYHVTVEWELGMEPVPMATRHPLVEPRWDLGTYDNGTHFHLFCPAGHETKRFGNRLPKRLRKVVYPETDR